MKLLLLGLGALSLGGTLLWCFQSNAMDWRLVLGLCSWIVAAALGLRAWRGAPKGRIRWDGAYWYWDLPSSDLPGLLQVVLDAQSLLLLRWRALPDAEARTSSTLWLWAERSGSERDWSALRRAVYSHSMVSQALASTAAPP